MSENIKLKSSIINGDFEFGSGSTNVSNYIGNPADGVELVLYGNPIVTASFDCIYKKIGSNSIKLKIESLGEKTGGIALIRLSANITSDVTWGEIQNNVERIKFKLTFWANTQYSGDVEVHKVYLSRKISDELNVPSISEIEFDINTGGIWKEYVKEFQIRIKDLEENLYLNIATGYEKDNFSGIGNFDGFDLEIINFEQKISGSNQIDLNQENLKPIPADIKPVFEDFLNSKSISDYEISSLINDDAYPFAAFGELMNREDISIKDFIMYIHAAYTKIEKQIFTYLEKNGVYVGNIFTEEREITLRELIENEYGKRMSSLILFYIKVLLSNILDDPDYALDSPASDHSSQLLAIVQTLKEKTSNVDQLRTLDLIETALDKFTNKTEEATGNVLTASERLDTLPSLQDTNNTNKDLQNSAANAIWELVDVASKNRIPKYEFRVGKEPLPQRSQQKMDFVLDVIKGIDPEKGKVNYNKWMTGYFDVGGGVVNQIVAEATQVKILQDFFEQSITTGLEKYSTLDVNNELKDFLASSLAKDLAKKRYEVKGTFQTLGEIGGAIFEAIKGDEREKTDYEVLPAKVKENLTEAIDKGYYTDDGNYHNPMQMDEATKNFLASSADTAAMEGLRESMPGLDIIPSNIGETVGINPLGDFSENSLGSAYFPDSRKGLENQPFEFSPSVSSLVGDKLKDTLSDDSINSLKSNIFNNPEYFRNSRFDSNFANNPEMMNALGEAGLSNFRLPHIQDAINSSFTQNNFDKNGDGFLSRMGTAGNELLGNINHKMGGMFDDSKSPTSNLLNTFGIPAIAAADRLGKAGIPFFPGNESYYNDLYGPEALAAKGHGLPTNYSPDVLSKLMSNDADFVDQVDPSNMNRGSITDQQMEQYKRYQQAMNNGSYGQNRPEQSPVRNAASVANEGGDNAQKAADKAPISAAVAGAVAGAALGSAPIALTGAVFGPPAVKMVGFLLGTEKNRLSEFTNGIAKYAGISGQDPRVIQNIRNIGGQDVIQAQLQEADNFWNKTFGRIPGLGKDYNLYSSIETDSVAGATTPTPGDMYFRSYGPLVQSLWMKEVNETDPQKKMEHQYAKELAMKVRREYYRWFKFKFSEASYLESLGIDSTFKGIRLSDLDAIRSMADQNGRIDYDSKQFRDFMRDNGYDTGRGLSSDGTLSVLWGKGMKIRQGLGGFYSGFMGLMSPLTNDTGMLGSFNYVFGTVPRSLGQLGGGFRTMYGALPSNAQKSIASFLGGKNHITAIPIEHSLLDINGNRITNIVNGKKSALSLFRGSKGYQSGLGNWWDNLVKQDVKMRKGFRAILFGDQKAFYKNKFIGGYWKFVGHGGDFLSFFQSSANTNIITSKLKSFFFNMMKNIASKLSKWILEKVTQAITKAVTKLVGTAAKGFVVALGWGCILAAIIGVLAVFIVIIITVPSKGAYDTGVGSGGFVGGLLVGAALPGTTITPGGPITCSNGKKVDDVTFRNKAYKAIYLDVPYVNQYNTDKGTLSASGEYTEFKNDTDKQSRVTDTSFTKPGGRVVGGGSMCGATSSIMVAAYYGQIPLTNSSTVVQDYNYMTKGQNITEKCSMSESGKTNVVSGAFAVTSGGGCGGSSIAGISKYLNLFGIQTSAPNMSPTVDSVYQIVKDSVDNNNSPVIISFSPNAPFDHVSLIIGYIYDPAEPTKVQGLVANDPYSNIQVKVDTGRAPDYTSTGPDGGKHAIYDLNSSKTYGGYNVLYVMKIANNNCKAPNLPGNNDVMVSSIWKHGQNYSMSSEFASLATSMKSVGIDLSTGGAKGDEVKAIEDKLITDARQSSGINETPPQIDTNNKVAVWGNPESEFVGKVDGQIGVDESGKISPSLIGKAGYGAYAPFIFNTAQKYSSQGVSPTLVSGKSADESKSLIFEAAKRGATSVVWTTTNYATMTTNKLNDYKLKKSSGEYNWNSNSGSTVNFIPNKHTLVFYGYNEVKGVVYLMDVFVNNQSSGLDAAGAGSSNVEMSITKFMELWSLFDYQAVIIEKK